VLKECGRPGCELCRVGLLTWKLYEYAIRRLADDPFRYAMADGRGRMLRELERVAVDEKESLALSAVRHVMQAFDDPYFAAQLREVVRAERRARRCRGF
jgi:hypothetical protein